jgi:hypothetical protein
MNKSILLAETGDSARQFPVETARRAFPSLNRGENFIFFDNAAGAQVHRSPSSQHSFSIASAIWRSQEPQEAER